MHAAKITNEKCARCAVRKVFKRGESLRARKSSKSRWGFCFFFLKCRLQAVFHDFSRLPGKLLIYSRFLFLYVFLPTQFIFAKKFIFLYHSNLKIITNNEKRHIL